MGALVRVKLQVQRGTKRRACYQTRNLLLWTAFKSCILCNFESMPLGTKGASDLCGSAPQGQPYAHVLPEIYDRSLMAQSPSYTLQTSPGPGWPHGQAT